MINPTVGKQLEESIIYIPDDYALRFSSLINTPLMHVFEGVVILHIDELLATRKGNTLSGMDIVNLFTDIILQLIEIKWSPGDIHAAADIVPNYLNILIPDARVRQNAHEYWTGVKENLNYPSRTEQTTIRFQIEDDGSESLPPRNEQDNIPQSAPHD
jgi:hypothetical protein